MQIRKMKGCLVHFFLAGVIGLFLGSCGGSNESHQHEAHNSEAPKAETKVAAAPTDPKENKGIGPVKEIQLAALDEAMVQDGKAIFEGNCTACHKINERYIGPALQGVTSRRSPEWIMNMILNPEQMVKEDPIAKELLAEYMAPMANQNLTEDQARKILEYFRTLE